MERRDQLSWNGLTQTAQQLDGSEKSNTYGGSPRLRSRDMFGDSSCLVIEHGREEYRLRITRLGKLILTK